MNDNVGSNGFANFGNSFQENLVKIIIKDRVFADQIQEVLKIEFFDLPHLRVLSKKILEYKEKYKQHPSIPTVRTIINSELKSEPDSIKEKVRDFFNNVVTSKDEVKDVRDEGYIKDRSLDFCRKQVLKNAMIKAVDCLERSSFDEINVLINEALKLGADNNFGYDYIADFETRFKIKMRNPVSTGWKEMDALLQNGLGKGELGIILAPTSTGKSMFIVHLGSQALKIGKNVVHYTLELSDTHVASRYDACITGVAINDLMNHKDIIYNTIKTIEGKLLIKEYPTKSASTTTIRAHLDKLLQRGFKFDLVLVDYADILRPVTSYKEKRHDLESIYEELRAIAQYYQVPVWTCSQTNRSGLNAEVITMESVSESFSKCFVADFIFSVSRTIEEKNSNTGKIFVAKNRMGPDGLVLPIFMDTSIVKIKILEEMQKTEEKEKKSLNEKYKEFLGDSRK